MKLNTLYDIILEGKFPVTNDMKRVAKYVANKAVELMNTDTPHETIQRFISTLKTIPEIDGETIKVDGGKYGQKEIYFSFAATHDKNEYNAFADLKASMIVVYINSNDYESYYDATIHEMIHIFDPKLNDPKLVKKSGERIKRHEEYKSELPGVEGQRDKYSKYIKLPHELDAHITTLADRIADYLGQRKNSIQGINAFIKALNRHNATFLPKSISKMYFLMDDKKVWRRFIRALSQSLEELKESGKLVDDPNAKRDAKVDIYNYKDKNGKYYYKMQTNMVKDYYSRPFDTPEQARADAKIVADAFMNW